jgi:hypothetical protein|tara:strand:+ start:484 stop:795 length:312 start_codon:yes stop_codon:yes gene_type:complete
MTIRYEGNMLVNLMSHKIIRTNIIAPDRGWYQVSCTTCLYEFKDGQDRHEWRMHLPALEFHKYRNGSFKTTQCHECFVRTMVIWQRSITEQIESMPESMRELA